MSIRNKYNGYIDQEELKFLRQMANHRPQPYDFKLEMMKSQSKAMLVTSICSLVTSCALIATLYWAIN